MIPKFRISIIFFHLQVKFRITVALALSIVSFFEGANSSLTAAVVVVTGLVGANVVQVMLDKLRFDDPIARGIATASSAHGLGTTALSAKEPEALPFCAIAYALTASTAAGSFVKGANFYGLAKGNARGGVPSARIAAC